uniref:Aspartyl/asparaginyl beta-hydroxylase n=1 Tax=Pithovirus LCPAC404 TaxID=2506597 RepID=A0A481ZDP4_9VIRU|nr:MAG: aspartyl/asparaginyl beta-hydroxylase [Pithovirus LCPAC404]
MSGVRGNIKYLYLFQLFTNILIIIFLKVTNVNMYVLLIIAIILVLGICIYIYFNDQDSKIDQKFYEVSDIYPKLNGIYKHLDNIKDELNEDQYWQDWPEKELYRTANKSWKIIPFKIFDKKHKSNHNKFPALWKFIESVPDVEIAILSKLEAGMKLNWHKGWGSHSNNILRCHFGLKVPSKNSCLIAVADDDVNGDPGKREIKYHKQDKWLIFDDSKFHLAENNSEFDRIVLIMDLKRPKHVKRGTSTVEESPELLKILATI